MIYGLDELIERDDDAAGFTPSRAWDLQLAVRTKWAKSDQFLASFYAFVIKGGRRLPVGDWRRPWGHAESCRVLNEMERHAGCQRRTLMRYPDALVPQSHLPVRHSNRIEAMDVPVENEIVFSFC